MTFLGVIFNLLDFRTTILRILSWSTRKKSPRYLWKMCWNSDQSHYILCYHGHHLHRLQIRNLHRLQMQDFCSFGFTLDWSILWRFKCCIRLKYKCPKGKDKTMYDLENVCPWDQKYISHDVSHVFRSSSWENVLLFGNLFALKKL